MPRRLQCRRIDAHPDCWLFSPEEASLQAPVVLSLDDYESIRLIDREDLT